METTGKVAKLQSRERCKDTATGLNEEEGGYRHWYILILRGVLLFRED